MYYTEVQIVSATLKALYKIKFIIIIIMFLFKKKKKSI